MCKGGIGRGGRGFKHAKNVPCEDPAEHLYTCNGRRHPLHIFNARVHYDTEEDYEDAQRNITEARPGPKGWCHECACERDDLPPKPPAPKRRRTQTGTRPLENHVAQRPVCAGTGEVAATRNRVAQLQWCTGKFHCPVCLPKGQTRRLGSKQCTDPQGHMPHGVARKDVVHVRPVGGAASQLTDAQLAAIPPEEMCEQCRGCQ